MNQLIPTFFILSLATILIPGLFSKHPIPTPKEDPIVGPIEPFFFERILKSNDLDDSIANHWNDPELRKIVQKHGIKLFGGPTLGKVTSTSATFWLRATKPGKIKLSIKEEADEREVHSVVGEATENNDLTLLLTVEELKPFTRYRITISDESGKVLARPEQGFRTSPAPGQKTRFSVAFGGGARYNPPKEKIWETIAGRKPHAFLFLGDNLYQDKPTHRNLQRVYYYRRQMRPEFVRLSSSTACYAIWDDHDFGPTTSPVGSIPSSPHGRFRYGKSSRKTGPTPILGVAKNNRVAGSIFPSRRLTFS